MDLLIFQLVMAYRQDPVFTVFFVGLSLIAGIAIGYGVLGPLLFG